jgi:hypothetical protein
MQFEKVEECDYNLFKSKKYELILKKYQPLIFNITLKFYNNVVKDKAIEFEDMIQMNKICVWKEILRTAEMFQKGTRIKFNDGMNFGYIAKLKLMTFDYGLAFKKVNSIHRGLLFLDYFNNELNERYVAYYDTIYHSQQLRDCLDTFVSQLYDENKTIMKNTLLDISDEKAAKKMKISLFSYKRLKNKLKTTFIKFIQQESNCDLMYEFDKKKFEVQKTKVKKSFDIDVFTKSLSKKYSEQQKYA